MFAQQTLLFISLSPEQQLPNGIFVLRAFSNGLHTNPVCSPQWQHLTTPRGVAIKPLRASSVASCHLPPIQFQEWKTMPFFSRFERDYFCWYRERCQKPSDHLNFPHYSHSMTPLPIMRLSPPPPKHFCSLRLQGSHRSPSCLQSHPITSHSP